MRQRLITVKNYKFEDSPTKKGFIGGTIIATNMDTGEETRRNYQRNHSGKTNKFDILGKMMLELVPPDPEPEEKEDVPVEEISPEDIEIIDS